MDMLIQALLFDMRFLPLNLALCSLFSMCVYDFIFIFKTLKSCIFLYYVTFVYFYPWTCVNFFSYIKEPLNNIIVPADISVNNKNMIFVPLYRKLYQPPNNFPCDTNTFASELYSLA